MNANVKQSQSLTSLIFIQFDWTILTIVEIWMEWKIINHAVEKRNWK